MKNSWYVEIGSASSVKHNRKVCGDTFLFKKIREEDRIVAVLSDGLGSGIKANVLATLTATMALKYMTGRMDIKKAAKTIMKTLPVCKIRKISYATFTMIDIASNGTVSIIEYDNPSFLAFKNNDHLSIEKDLIVIPSARKKPVTLLLSQFTASEGDRIIFHSDGLTQSGIGTSKLPLGWGCEGVQTYIQKQITEKPLISARELAQNLVKQAHEHDAWNSGDDTTCGVIYFRIPRKLIVFTGPPVKIEDDAALAGLCSSFDGKKIICGGTTAKIIARELNRPINVDMRNFHPEVPPLSIMDGIDLVTEGIITMTKTAQYLEEPQTISESVNAAFKLYTQFLESDDITFIVGTRLNDANRITGNHNVELRHAIVRRIAGVLEERYLKKINVRFM
ncbi:MAG TPA: SpoIIE family protein phosphatase [Chitinispirillaceae bacterium]|nr:SpoIIE family protein phosphatase [Chitinispirillaceae bacterium]